ncbi:MAG: fused MFS/spermidine synthase [Bryobacterales bacterium]|nr:fused MFS/spermidine synthase [Bryobacterales bacterium]
MLHETHRAEAQILSAGPSPLPAVAVGAILLAEGYASLAAEILALRRMVPFAGSAVSVTALLLAVYLAALAGGYRRGGRLARSGDPRPRLALRLAAAAALAAFWLSDAGSVLAFGLPVPELAQVAVYSLVGIAPIGWLLAECVLLAHACARGVDPSRTAGGVFAVSTVGNVGGALLTTFVLLRFLGTAAATIALVVALCLAALAAHRRSVPAAALLAAAMFPLFDLWIEATVYVERNAYADYRIVELNDGGRVLDVSGQAASRHDGAGLGWEYAERIEKTLCEAGETRVLVLGAAGMTLGRGAPCELDVAFVDIDPAQRRIAGLFLGAEVETSGTFAAADARAFLRDDPGDWPAIVVDTYSNPRILPQHLLTVEFYRLARSRLSAEGTLYVNHLAWPDDTLFRTRAERTLRSVFADCSSWPVGIEQGRGWYAASSESGNLLFRCRKGPHDGDTAIYSDAVPRADLDRSLR